MDYMTPCVYVCIAPVTTHILQDDPPNVFSLLSFGF